MAFLDANVDDPGGSFGIRSAKGAARPSRRSLVSRLMSRASATYCAVCGEELTATAVSLSTSSGRYCVEDHTLGARR